MPESDFASARRARSDNADSLLRELFEVATDGAGGFALAAVGGYGRQELSPFSDLDLVLVHAPEVSTEHAGQVAERIWYPLWDRKVDLDHAVRSAKEMVAAAKADYRSAIGMLDVRTVAGETSLISDIRSAILADWRKAARKRVTTVRAERLKRIERFGWLAYEAQPDVKEAGGGLRDGVVMRALVATWLVDVPRVESEQLRSALLDVRDALHAVAGRRTDRLVLDDLPEIAERLGTSADALDRSLRELGWRSAHLIGVTWKHIEQVLDQSRFPRRRPQRPRTIAPSIAESGREIVLTRRAAETKDPALALRAASLAATSGRLLSTAAAHELANVVALSEPWSPTARHYLVSLLTSGPGLVDVWDELDFAGVVDAWLPEWDRIRRRGSSSPVHRFTIDRHLLETCVETSRRLRDVGRPDVLAVASLLHDIGKGGPGDHSEAGEPMAVAIARRWGFTTEEAELVGFLVRRHLLLPTIATRRDIEDPATAEFVAEIVGDVDRLDLLAALTESDARATSAAAWSDWRAGLVRGLVDKVRAVLIDAPSRAAADDYDGWLDGVALPPGSFGADGFALRVDDHHSGSLLVFAEPDRIGSVADIAGAISVAGLEILSARMVTRGQIAYSMWEVTRPGVEPERVVARLRQILAGDIDLAQRLAAPGDLDGEVRVKVGNELGSAATVLEVRAPDRRGLVWSVARTIADVGHSIRSAHLSTYGPAARDVFYVVDAHGARLAREDESRLTAEVATALR